MSCRLSLFMLLSLQFPFLELEEVASRINGAARHYSYEPSCGEVIKKALKTHAAMSKLKIPSTKAVRASAILPLLRVSVSKNMEYDESFALSGEDNSSLKIYTDDDLTLKITVQWDLASLVFNDSETPLIARQHEEAKWKMEIMKTVAEVYHSRRKLQVLLFILGGELPLETAVEWTMKVEELTSILDALTDGWFSEEKERRLKLKK